MIWGEDELHITVGRAGFWDRRNGTGSQQQPIFALCGTILKRGMLRIAKALDPRWGVRR